MNPITLNFHGSLRGINIANPEMIAKDSYMMWSGWIYNDSFEYWREENKKTRRKQKQWREYRKGQHTLKLNVILSSFTLSPLTWTHEIGGWDNSKHTISGVIFPLWEIGPYGMLETMKFTTIWKNVIYNFSYTLSQQTYIPIAYAQK
jgi:hypothetical protein